jgi:hypothetical protein
LKKDYGQVREEVKEEEKEEVKSSGSAKKSGSFMRIRVVDNSKKDETDSPMYKESSKSLK